MTGVTGLIGRQTTIGRLINLHKMQRLVLAGHGMAISAGIGCAVTRRRPYQDAVQTMALATVIVLGVIDVGGRHPGRGSRCARVAVGAFGA